MQRVPALLLLYVVCITAIALRHDSLLGENVFAVLSDKKFYIEKFCKYSSSITEFHKVTDDMVDKCITECQNQTKFRRTEAKKTLLLVYFSQEKEVGT